MLGTNRWRHGCVGSNRGNNNARQAQSPKSHRAASPNQGDAVESLSASAASNTCADRVLVGVNSAFAATAIASTSSSRFRFFSSGVPVAASRCSTTFHSCVAEYLPPPTPSNRAQNEQATSWYQQTDVSANYPASLAACFVPPLLSPLPAPQTVPL